MIHRACKDCAKWVKPNTLYFMLDVSASTILKLIKSGILIQGKHYKVFPFGRRFNLYEIEKLTTVDSIGNLIDNLLQ